MLRALLAFTLIFTTAAFSADNSRPVHSDYTYQYSDNLSQRVAQASAQAINENKHLMLVLGADWCHDSRGFAQQLSEPNLTPLIQQHYVPVFVDVGTYRDMRWLTERYDYPGYYATPTVMLVNPMTQQLINRDNMVLWNTADKVEHEAYVEYFTHYANLSEPQSGATNNPSDRLQQVRIFATQNTARLFAGFARLGPMMQLAFNDELEDFTELKALSEEVYEFRMQLQKDYHRLYTIAAAHPDETIQLPLYGPFSWEDPRVSN